ncbi:acyclic terpene utilization AtuA family protein, partial [Solicola sp. PLA-1-18]|uniref:acyclic terpene utilization AtuA family protein n=1 Tax=Solicola sp. PLA-1-18 TaxID=3380532 RepID=UPI003B7C136C
EGGELDFLTGDWLAELTMLILGRDAMKDPTLGYARTFVRQLDDCLGLALDRGVRIVSNAGGLNPAGLADAVRAVAERQGLSVAVAHVEGDDLRGRTDELGLTGFGGSEPLTANAYLGAFGIKAALDAGADVVVTGRVTDASVVVGCAAHAHGWGRGAHDELAGATLAGHVLECGTQATGGNFSGFLDLPRDTPQQRRLGFPLAEVAADGSCVVTKHPGTGGAVTVDTVTAQLVYEIQGRVYLGPDVATDLGTVQLVPDGPDRVRMTGTRGFPPPPDVKVCLNTLGGWRNSVEMVLTGLDVDEKAAFARAQVEDHWDATGTRPAEVEWRRDGDVLGCHVRDTAPDPVGRAFTAAVVELALGSYPGFHVTRPPTAGTPFGVYTAAYVPQTSVPHVVVLGNGTRVDVPPPEVTRPADDPWPPTEGVPVNLVHVEHQWETATIGDLVHARSGDKGGDANVGLWTRAEGGRGLAGFTWLCHEAEALVRTLPDVADRDVLVVPLRNLHAVNVVVRGLLGDGVASSTRPDPQAKALGEQVRALTVPVWKDVL